MEIENKEQFFVGYNLSEGKGRVSTAIESFDASTGRGRTRSGRIYQLLGPAGYDADGHWVWNFWVQARQVKWVDVTDQYVEMLRGRSKGC